MDFRDAINIVTAELTPQPWEYTDQAGTTLTVIPAGLREAPGCAEVVVRVTASRTLAAETRVPTVDLPEMIAAVAEALGWEHFTVTDDRLALIPDDNGDLILTIGEMGYGRGEPVETTAAVRVPAAQRLPLASALRRATDVARGWEDEA